MPAQSAPGGRSGHTIVALNLPARPGYDERSAVSEEVMTMIGPVRTTAAATALGVALVLGASTFGAFAQEPPRRGGTLIYALGSDPPHLNGAITNDLNTLQTATQIY